MYIDETHFGLKSGVVWLDQVACDGTELSLLDCEHKPLLDNNCDEENVGLSCF